MKLKCPAGLVYGSPTERQEPMTSDSNATTLDREAPPRPSVRDAMSSATPCVSSEETLLAAAKRLIWTGSNAIPVVNPEGRSLGLITQRDLMRCLASEMDMRSSTVGEVVTTSAVLAPDDPLDEAPAAIGAAGTPMLPVVTDGQLVGVLSMLDVDAYRQIHAVLGDRIGNLATEISPSDAMHRGSRGAYVVAGVSALECARVAMQLVSKSQVSRILDLPCGHGRVLRVLKAAFPGADLTACDLDRDGVDFCARVLGAEPVYSNSDPHAVKLAGDFDLIWCGSLFTHLDAQRWAGFLELLGDSLTPGGLLLFTTHGRHPAQAIRSMGINDAGVRLMLEGYDEDGFGYSATPYDQEPDWGLSIASPEWVRKRVDEQPNLRLVKYAVKAWLPPAPRQDVVICLRPGEPAVAQ